LYPIAALGSGLRVEWVDSYQDCTMTACLSDKEGQRTHICIDGRKTVLPITVCSSKHATPDKKGQSSWNWVAWKKASSCHCFRGGSTRLARKS